jgi:hypothetical protein
MSDALVTTTSRHRRRRPPTTGFAAADAREDFQRARWAYLVARAKRWLKAQRPSRTRPRDLGDVPALSRRTPRLRPIPLEAIVGTVDAAVDFDAGFRPATDRIASRIGGRASPAHTAKVAPCSRSPCSSGPTATTSSTGAIASRSTALGHPDIDAWTSPPGPVPHAQPNTNEEKPMAHLTDRLRVALGNALREHHAAEPVHFHAGDHGRPYVCEDPHCSSPSLTTTSQ